MLTCPFSKLFTELGVAKQSKWEALRQVDICFVVDTTGSMSPFINEAKHRLVETVSRLSSDSSIQLQVALVEYRDHPPQEKSFVTRTYALTSNMSKVQSYIAKLTASGGGDEPEAVYDGVAVACRELDWREHSLRFALLVGDAPPHVSWSPWCSACPSQRRFRRRVSVRSGREGSSGYSRA